MTSAKEQEFRDLMTEFQLNHDSQGFDPLPMLIRIAECLEWANDEYFANNPDPLDTRHPIKVLPSCALGYMLRHLHRNTDFFDRAMVSYLMPHERSEVNVMAARVLVSTLPIMDPSCFTSDVIKELYNYALFSDSRELRAYSTILLNAGMTPENAHTYRLPIVRLITESLQRLELLYDQMVNGAPSREEEEDETAEDATPPANDDAKKLAIDFSQIRKSELALKNQTPPSTADATNDVANSAASGIVNRKRAAASTHQVEAKRARRAKQNGGASTPLADAFNTATSTAPDASNCSTSTVDDIRRIIIGNNKIYPLTIEMEQRMILQFLQSVCEFTDHLSILCDHKALEAVMRYLNVNDYHDIRLLFEAIYCIGTMLIHLRLAWDFVNMQGLSKLIAVNRQSVAASAVCVCFHHLGQFDDLMEHVCQSPTKLLDRVMEYAIWQLGQGYESSGARICGIFRFRFTF